MHRKRSASERSMEERLHCSFSFWHFQLRVRRPPRSRKISGPDVHDAHLLVRDPRSLRDDRTPDHSGIPDDLIGLPADMELKLDHFYRIFASDGLGNADLNLFSAFIDHECHKF